MLRASPTSRNGAAIIVPAACAVDPTMNTTTSAPGDTPAQTTTATTTTTDEPDGVSEQDWSIGHAQRIAVSAIAGIVDFFMAPRRLYCGVTTVVDAVVLFTTKLLASKPRATISFAGTPCFSK